MVADDQELVSAGFAAVLRTQPDLEVVGEAADGREAVEQVRRHRPDVVLMDIQMPHVDGIEATLEICADPRSATRVLILTTFDLDEYVLAALRAGATGFLLKDAPRADALRRRPDRRGRRRPARPQHHPPTDRTAPPGRRAAAATCCDGWRP